MQITFLLCYTNSSQDHLTLKSKSKYSPCIYCYIYTTLTFLVIMLCPNAKMCLKNE